MAPVVKVVPLFTVRLLVIARFTTVVVVTVPLKVSVPIVVVPVVKVLAALPEKFKMS